MFLLFLFCFCSAKKFRFFDLNLFLRRFISIALTCFFITHRFLRSCSLVSLAPILFLHRWSVSVALISFLRWRYSLTRDLFPRRLFSSWPSSKDFCRRSYCTPERTWRNPSEEGLRPSSHSPSGVSPTPRSLFTLRRNRRDPLMKKFILRELRCSGCAAYASLPCRLKTRDLTKFEDAIKGKWIHFTKKRFIVLGLCRKRSPNNRGRLLGETFFVCATSLSLLQCWCLSRIYSQASVPYLAHFSLLRQLFLWGVC